MNTAEVMLAVQTRYSGKAWAFLPQVRRGRGFGAQAIADAIAMSLWPSRGLEIHGFEIKVSRGDWLRELRKPAKADMIFRLCDRWWLAVGDASIVRDGELPPTWGLLTPVGKSLVPYVQAPKLTPTDPLDRDFVASILKQASAFIAPTIKASSENGEYQRGFAAGRDSLGAAVTRDCQRLTQLQAQLTAFEEASGIRIDSWNDGKRMGDALNIVMHRKNLAHVISRHGRMHQEVMKLARTLRAQTQEMSAILEKDQ